MRYTARYEQGLHISISQASLSHATIAVHEQSYHLKVQPVHLCRGPGSVLCL